MPITASSPWIEGQADGRFEPHGGPGMAICRPCGGRQLRADLFPIRGGRFALFRGPRSESVYNPADSDSRMTNPLEFSMTTALAPASRQKPGEISFHKTMPPRPITFL